MTLIVSTWLWQDPGYRWNNRYRVGPRHVNRLYRAVHDHLDMPHEFVCFADDPTGIDPGVRVLPVPMTHAELGMCWRRLWLFSRETLLHFGVGVRIVQMDLDCAVLGDLTPLFDRPEPFVAWRPYDHYCGSMLMLEAGARVQVWDSFDPVTSPPAVKHLIGSDQAWMQHVLGPGEAVWTERDGIYSFRKSFGKSGLPGRDRRMGKHMAPPEGCRIVFFHGPWDISMPSLHAAYPWIGSYWAEQPVRNAA